MLRYCVGEYNPTTGSAEVVGAFKNETQARFFGEAMHLTAFMPGIVFIYNRENDRLLFFSEASSQRSKWKGYRDTWVLNGDEGERLRDVNVCNEKETMQAITEAVTGELLHPWIQPTPEG